MDLSIVIPCRNEEAFLELTIRALLVALNKSKLITSSEVFVVLDGCNDGSAEIAARLPVKSIVVKGIGRSAAKTIGYQKSKSQRIMFLDADCVVAPSFFMEYESVLQAQFDWLQPMVIYDSRQFGFMTSDFESIQLRRQFPKGDTGAVIINRSAIDRFFGFNPKLSRFEDRDLCQKIFVNGGILISSPKMIALKQLSYTSFLDLVQKRLLDLLCRLRSKHFFLEGRIFGWSQNWLSFDLLPENKTIFFHFVFSTLVLKLTSSVIDVLQFLGSRFYVRPRTDRYGTIQNSEGKWSIGGNGWVQIKDQM